jgi:pyruvate,water dikinase
VVIRDPAAAPPSLPADAVLVVSALLPQLAYLLPSARALVTAHGGATSHGATLAREYGVPAVLGIGTLAIADGAELWVDGAAGRVYLL